jgi:methylated-DNA-[protein]-cysteine S-methyltransferase
MPPAHSSFATPLGPMFALWDDRGLSILSWQEDLGIAKPPLSPPPAALAEPMAAYLGGDIHALRRIPAHPLGTDFQRAVWAALQEVPPGQTWSYGQLARHIDRPKAYRAVAQACGANPIALVIPCHRIIAAEGRLGGFSAGLERKRWLLAHEGAWTDPAQRQTYLWKSSSESEKPLSTTSSPACASSSSHREMSSS